MGGRAAGDLDIAERTASDFYVTDGRATIGPVDGDLIVRGIEAGKVPLEASVWKTGWPAWRSVREFAAEQGVLASAEAQAASARGVHVSDLSPLQLPATAKENAALAQAKDLKEAGRTFLSLCAAATGAECGWVHVHSRSAGGAMVTLDGIGPRAAFGIGRTLDPSDQALRVAREGRTVLSEPLPGVVGSAVTARILATGISPVSVLMTPVLCAGQLIVMVELGVASRAAGFSAREAAIAEQIARDLSAIARKNAWHRS